MTRVVSGGSWVVRRCLPIPFNSILPSVKGLFYLVEKTTVNLMVLPKLSLIICSSVLPFFVRWWSSPFLSPCGHASLVVGFFFSSLKQGSSGPNFLTFVPTLDHLLLLPSSRLLWVLLEV